MTVSKRAVGWVKPTLIYQATRMERIHCAPPHPKHIISKPY